MALSPARSGYPMNYTHPSEIMDEIAATTPTFAGVSYAKLDELGSIQWPCNDAAPQGTPIMHVDRFVRGKGQFMLTEYVPTDERTGPRFPLMLTTGPHPRRSTTSARRRGAPRTAAGMRRTCSRSIRSTPRAAASATAISVALQSRAGETRCARKVTERMQPGVVYTTFHHPEPGANVVTTDNSDWATNCPEYKVTAVQVRRTNHYSRLAGARPRGGLLAAAHRRGSPMQASEPRRDAARRRRACLGCA